MPDASVTIFYWCQDTALVPFETGIQRVVRRLADKLSQGRTKLVPVGWDERSRQVVSLPSPSVSRRRQLDLSTTDQAVLFVPEIPLSLICAGLDPYLLGRAYGLPTVGLVHDLIPIKLAADYSPGVVAMYRGYFRQFSAADLVLTTTTHVAADLRAFLDREGLVVPPIEVVSLPAEMGSVLRQRAPPPVYEPGDTLKLIAVSTWEPRKNILRLLRAIARASGNGHPSIRLDLVGRRGAFPAYDEEVLSTARAVSSVTLHGTVSDTTLLALYAASHASVYPSLEEGFGLPILESLWLGRPCLCHSGSSMAEVAPGGGTVQIDMTDESAIADALCGLSAPGRIRQLALEAIARPLRDWQAFADDIAQRLARLARAC